MDTSNLFGERWPGRQRAGAGSGRRRYRLYSVSPHCDRIASERTQKIFKTLQKHEHLSSGEVKWGLNGGSPLGDVGWAAGRDTVGPGARTAPEHRLPTRLAQHPFKAPSDLKKKKKKKPKA